YRQREKPTGEKVAINIDAGTNPPSGVLVQYWLREKPTSEATLAFVDSRGRLIREFKSDPKALEEEPKAEAPEKTPPEGTVQPPPTKDPKVSVAAGLNRFLWNMRHADATKVEGEGGTWEAFEAQLAGPQVPPGSYRVRLKIAGETHEAPFEIRKDPRIATSQGDLEAQTALGMEVNRKLDETHRTINAIRRLKTQLDGWEARAKDQSGQGRLARAAASLRQRASAIEAELVQVKAKSRQDTLNYPAKLNAKLASLGGYIGGADFAPTSGMRAVFEDVSKRVDAQIAKWDALVAGDVAAFDKLVRTSGLPAVAAGEAKKTRRAATPRKGRKRAREMAAAAS
ncbi:MAG TPA: glycosyl hydrolase, partial [Candidatus Limnocylindria bacterium]|nr:glycosyl hydrolase [Candidatus Limnocylindria bacterium]